MFKFLKKQINPALAIAVYVVVVALALTFSITLRWDDSEPATGPYISLSGLPVTTTVAPGPIATASAPAIRETAVQIVETMPPPETFPDQPGKGDCDAWFAEFVRHGATEAELAYFFTGGQSGKGIVYRETMCGLRTINPSTSDRGICQTNGVHAEPGYFGGRYFGMGGWLLALLDIRHPSRLDDGLDSDSTDWVDACLLLFRVCGKGPWTPNDYSCRGTKLESLGY